MTFEYRLVRMVRLTSLAARNPVRPDRTEHAHFTAAAATITEARRTMPRACTPPDTTVDTNQAIVAIITMDDARQSHWNTTFAAPRRAHGARPPQAFC
ncbi:MAG: hypothetical protein PUF97_06005 [Bifidobacteriaceae bacterium]|nr:hypothetical protein [Bifidobacteriaceae bacterium]